MLDRRGPGNDGEVMIRRDCGCDGVAGECREIGDQAMEAVHGQPVGGVPGGPLRLGHGAGAQRVGGFLVGVAPGGARRGAPSPDQMP